MKKIFYAIMGAALLLLAGCEEKGEVFYQNPYRIIVDFGPSTFTIDGLSGNVTPDADYDWITSNGNGSFTVRRNTSGLIRRAEFTVAGSKDKAIINQRAHSLDGSLNPSLAGQGLGTADLRVTFSSKFPDDYASWGLIYNTSNDRASGKSVQMSGAPVVGNNLGHLTGLAEDTDYFIWAYVESTEGDKIYSDFVPMIPPVYVKAGEDLQAAIDGAKEFAEIRVAGGATFNGTILFDDKNKNKSISGGWNADFTEQSWDNLTIIDGQGKNRCFYFANDVTSSDPLTGYVDVSYFDIRNGFCATGHGGGLKVVGGPVTIHHCWFHHNEADRGGAFSTIEDDSWADITVYDCVITDNVANGHAGAFSIEDGMDHKNNPNKAVIVGNLIANNRSIKHDGYAGSVYFYQKVNVQFVNNTVINSLNFYEDNGNWWGSFYCRWNTNATIANNMILRTWCSKSDNHAFVEEWPIEGGSAKTTFINNIVTGKLWNCNGPQSGNLLFEHTVDATRFLNNPDVDMVPDADLQNKEAVFKYNKLSDFIGENYMPKGDAIGAGTLGTFDYQSYDGNLYKSDINSLLMKFGNDINGNPFIKDGKVDIGALQSK